MLDTNVYSRGLQAQAMAHYQAVTYLESGRTSGKPVRMCTCAAQLVQAAGWPSACASRAVCARVRWPAACTAQ